MQIFRFYFELFLLEIWQGARKNAYWYTINIWAEIRKHIHVMMLGNTMISTRNNTIEPEYLTRNEEIPVTGQLVGAGGKASPTRRWFVWIDDNCVVPVVSAQCVHTATTACKLNEWQAIWQRKFMLKWPVIVRSIQQEGNRPFKHVNKSIYIYIWICGLCLRRRRHMFICMPPPYYERSLHLNWKWHRNWRWQNISICKLHIVISERMERAESRMNAICRFDDTTYVEQLR